MPLRFDFIVEKLKRRMTGKSGQTVAGKQPDARTQAKTPTVLDVARSFQIGAKRRKTA